MSPELDQLASWIRARHPDAGPIGPADDLIESRLIDSLSFLQFVVEIERLAGYAIDIEAAGIESFQSLERIGSTFFRVPDPARR